jgi:peptidoglycan/xylan/chitin deacetylase (PgdA/CDA1 family)
LTVDDGYRDFADIAVPILSRYGIPATVFVARDFIDGGRWYWWDRIDHAFVQTASHRARVRLGDRGTCEYSWNAPAEKALAQRRFTEDCKEIDDTAKWQAIEELETELRVEVPVDVPVRYRGVTWDDVRKLSDAGIEIGGHTVTHPILSRVPPERAEAEVVECLDAILHHTGKRPRTFAYPNGRRGDFTPWVMDVLDREGIIGAVTGEHGIVSAPLLDTLERPMYQLPRIAMPSTWEGFVQAVSGVEALKQQLGYR